MNRLLLCAIGCLFAFRLGAQEPAGRWQGILNIGNTGLHIVLHIETDGTAYKASMDSPDQGAKEIPVSSLRYEAPELAMEIAAIGASFNATLKGDTLLEGTFTQAGQSLPLLLAKVRMAARPQTPRPPYPYTSLEVTFPNREAGITLAGTLTLPEGEGRHPAVILVSGSGPQNRDEEIAEHRPFLVIADYLTRRGIAVLRFDDRGTGSSEGDFQSATDETFSTDAEAALHYLHTRKEIDADHIGIVGHSAGGTAALMLAARDKTVKFVVSLAGAIERGDRLMLKQAERIGKANGMSDEAWQAVMPVLKERYALLRQEKPVEEIREELYRHVTASLPPEATDNEEIMRQVKGEIAAMTSAWYLYMMRHDPAETLQKVTCPVLALNGEKDTQVDADTNLSALLSALQRGGNNRVTVVRYPDLNHLFQHCKTGLPNEYADIEETISPEVLNDMTLWIKKITR